MKPQNNVVTISASVFLLLSATTAHANDAALSYGGSPKMLTGHPSVVMKNERIRMTVGEKEAVVDCTFVFENHGPACKVRMGFPDQTYGGDETADAALTGAFTKFRSSVDGKPVQTSIARGDKEGLVWHVKTVDFPANATRTIHELYTVPIGGGIEEIGGGKYGNAQFTSYLLHTGASWHGPIGRTEVIVTFDRAGLAAPLAPSPVPGEEGFARPPARDWSGEHGRIYYQGPCKPTVEGRTLRFVRTNWEPAEKDDILLTFEMRRAKD